MSVPFKIVTIRSYQKHPRGTNYLISCEPMYEFTVLKKTLSTAVTSTRQPNAQSFLMSGRHLILLDKGQHLSLWA